ncbi:MAG TPA: twin-arginine translocase TatA/TatE family subunit [Candidatus Dormibacteraeota bacterium]|nr:twin-arginine translocase TatA/TatE family subunit [Candidatus Dormibacteraeota bacterium]
MISPTHLFLLALLIVLALIVFGPKRLPELGSSVGRAIQEFKKASSSTVDEVRSMAADVTAPASTPPAADASAAAATAPSAGESQTGG